MTPFKQFNTILKAKTSFSFRANGARGKAVNVQEGSLWEVTSPEYRNIKDVIIDRKGKAKLNIGYSFTIEMVNQYFEILP